MRSTRNTFRIIRPDGAVRWLESSLHPVTDGDAVRSVHGVLTDVTDRVRGERRRALLLAVTRALAQSTAEGETIQRGLVGRLVTSLFPALAGRESGATGHLLEVEGLRDGGGRFPAEIALAGWDTTEGRRHTLAVRDITDRRRVETSMRERTLLSARSAGVAQALAGEGDKRAMLQRCAELPVEHLDAAFARIWTLDAKAGVLMLQASAGMYTHRDGAHGRIPLGAFKIGRIASSRMPHLTNSVLEDPQISDPEWARREGMVAFAGHPLQAGDEVLGVMAVFARRPLSDSTLEALASISNAISLGIKRKRAERAALERQRHLEAIFSALDQVFFTITWPQGRVLQLAGGSEAMLGAAPPDLLGNIDVCRTLVHANDGETLDRAFLALDRGMAARDRVRLAVPGQRARWVELRLHPVRDTGLVHGVVTDVSETVRAEQRRAVLYAVTRLLAECEDLEEAGAPLLREICAILTWEGGVLWRPDADGEPARCTVCWYSGRYRAGAESMCSSGRLTCPIAEAAATACRGGCTVVPIVSGGRHRGSLQFFWRPEYEPETALLELLAAVGSQLGQFMERREAEQARTRIEQQFLHAQKMEAVGTLAGGVAHDFNNLLTAITGYGELALARASSDETTREYIEEVLGAAERAGALTRQLLTFSRKQVVAPRILRLDDVVGGLEKMLRRLITESVGLETRLEAPDGFVRADSGQVEQVVLNLVVNARDAMPDGGSVVLATCLRDVDTGELDEWTGIRSGRYACLSVTDTGCGMDEAVQARIFEPFFTTKETGRGTGLGLSTVFGIVRQAGGEVRVRSRPGQGA